MAAAAIIAIRKNGGNAAADTGGQSEMSELTERMPPVESREVDVEIGMLLIGYTFIFVVMFRTRTLADTLVIQSVAKKEIRAN